MWNFTNNKPEALRSTSPKPICHWYPANQLANEQTNKLVLPKTVTSLTEVIMIITIVTPIAMAIGATEVIIKKILDPDHQ